MESPQITHAAKFRNPKTDEIQYVWEQADIDYFQDVLGYELIGYVDYDLTNNRELKGENTIMKRRSRNFREGYKNPYTNARQKKAFDDACDCIHNGYGKMYWKKNFRNGLDLSQLDDVWDKAYDYMNESLQESKNLKEDWYNGSFYIKVTTEREMNADDIRDMAWSGAKDTLEDLDDDQLNTVLQILAEEYPDGIDETQLNDILWFERDTIANWLGYRDFDALMHESNLSRDELYVDEYAEGEWLIYNEDGAFIEGLSFETEEEAQEYLDEHRDEFTEDDFS